MGSDGTRTVIAGQVAPGCEEVPEESRRNLAERGELGAAGAVVRGRGPLDAAAPAGIRRATRGDAEPIAQMINGAFAIEREFIDGDRISVEDVTALIDTGEFLVATTDTGQPVGCIYVESRPPTGYIAELAVDREHREAGIGSRLLAAAEARCRGRGCASVEIRVLNLRPELFPFYRRRGYVECGTEPLAMEAARRARRPCQFIRMKKQL